MTDLGPRPTMSTARAAELIGTTAKNVAAMWRAGELGGVRHPHPSRLPRAQDPHLHRLGRRLPAARRTGQPAEGYRMNRTKPEFDETVIVRDLIPPAEITETQRLAALRTLTRHHSLDLADMLGLTPEGTAS